MVKILYQCIFWLWSVVCCVLLLTTNGYGRVEYSVNATAGVLFEYNTGQFLVQQNADEPIAPASFTKVMTLFVAQEALEKGVIALDDLVTVSAKAWKTGGSQMFIEVNTRVSVSDLIKGIAVVSGNDACVALAEHISGKEEVFVEQMNQVAQRLKLEHTVFKDSHGLSKEGQQTTAKDMAVLAYHYIKEYPQALEFHSLTEYTYNNITQPNRNRLLRTGEGVDGLKTGYLESSGYHLLATAERDGRRLIAVIMGAETWAERENEALKLLNYGFRNFEIKDICRAGQTIASIPVKRGKDDTVDAVAEHDLAVTTSKLDPDAVKVIEDFPALQRAPVYKGDIVGSLTVVVDGEPLHKVSVTAKEDVAKSWVAYWPVGVVAIAIVVMVALVLRIISRKRTPQAFS